MIVTYSINIKQDWLRRARVGVLRHEDIKIQAILALRRRWASRIIVQILRKVSPRGGSYSLSTAQLQKPISSTRPRSYVPPYEYC
jgi:hypothetical protein